MPAAPDILQGLTALANRWETIAVAWHVVFVAGLLVFDAGWRPARRLLAGLLLLPLSSVSVLAWQSGNAVNGTLFAVLVAGLGFSVGAMARERIELLQPGMTSIVGAALLLLGVVYPHFVDSASWIDYLASAPLGVVPCPTLLAVGGVTLLSSLHRERRWMLTLGTFAIMYGVLGAVYLGVLLDLALVAGGLVMVGQPWLRRTGTHALVVR